MRNRWKGLPLTVAALWGLSATAGADVLTLECRNTKAAYRIAFDTEKQSLVRQDATMTVTYKVMRTQFENGDGLVWGVTREHGGDMLAFFGSKTMVKYFYGNGSETTDACTQK